MKILSGTTDQYVYFVAVDATDFTTRETALSSFTVYRSRNGAAAAAMTTPTINETDATNMPGVYELLLDEDMTIGAGNLSEQMVFHVTHAGMAPVTLEIELYSLDPVADAVLDEALSGHSTAGSLGKAITDTETDAAAILVDTSTTLDGKINTIDTNVDAILVDTSTTLDGKLNDIQGGTFNTSTDSLEAIRDRGDAAWTTGAGGTPPQLLQSTTIASLSSQTSFTLTAGSSDNDAYNGAVVIVTDQSTSTQKAVGSISDYVGSTKTVTLSADPGIFTMAVGDTIDILAAISNAPTAATIADAVLDEALSGHTTAGTLGKAVADIEADTNELQTDNIPGTLTTIEGKVDTVDTVADGIKAVTDNLPNSGALSSLATASALATVDTNVDSILTDTGTTLPATLATILADTNELQTDDVPGLIAALNNISAADILTTALTESYAADGAAPTLSQLLFLVQQMLTEKSISGTTMTVKRLDGSTTAATLTLNDATTPTSVTRTT
ncbi:MAG: hypothetical protein NXI13_16375 [Proteobacteria bacterium]|nr:hypothetical protein [Pseudomonadota bacterium]